MKVQPIAAWLSLMSGIVLVSLMTANSAVAENPIEIYTLTNSQGLEARVMTYGATLLTVKTPDQHGVLKPITLYLDHPTDYQKGHPLFGSIIGRFANRIAGARICLDGIDYPLTANAGQHHIHGGRNGFQNHLWTATPVSDPSRHAVEFSLTSPDGDEGYPGTLQVTVRYELTETNELLIQYTATTDKPTVLNLTNHMYWNLAGAGSGDVLSQELQLFSDFYLPTDEHTIPTGEIASVQGTAMDFRQSKTIGADIDKTPGQNYDHCYVVQHPSGTRLAKIAIAYDPQSGRGMEVYTTQPGFQLYTAKHLSNRYQAGGKEYGPYHGFCLETQNFPDAPNRSHFPSSVLRPGETYDHQTVFAFYAKSK